MQIFKGGIAFFDSGIGGLTVLSEAKKLLPNEIFYYYGDNARAPYGNLPKEKITQFVTEAFDSFQTLQVKASVLACNTATAVCADTLRKKYPFAIIGAEPAVFSAVKEGSEILVLSTRATFQSQRFIKLLERARAKYPTARITPKSCDNLAGAIERNLTDPSFDFTPYLPPADKKYTAVVLGCTHYIYIKEKISSYYHCPAIDGNAGIANRLAFILNADPFCVKNEKYRDGRPLVTSLLGFSAKEGDNALLSAYLGAPIYFLGTQKHYNKSIYEQMFANPCK